MCGDLSAPLSRPMITSRLHTFGKIQDSRRFPIPDPFRDDSDYHPPPETYPTAVREICAVGGRTGHASRAAGSGDSGHSAAHAWMTASSQSTPKLNMNRRPVLGSGEGAANDHLWVKFANPTRTLTRTFAEKNRTAEHPTPPSCWYS